MSGKKNVSDIFDCNLEKNCRILIIFDTNISDTAGDQITIQLFHPTHCLLLHFLGNKINEIL